MNLRHLPHALTLWFLLALAGTATAATTVELVDAWPAGDAVVLAAGERYYVRVRYRSDTPVRLWVRPMWRGEPAMAGSNPSPEYVGEGEAVGWFFLLDDDARVDEVQVQVGGSRHPDVALRLPVSVRRGVATDAGPVPAWVAALQAGEQHRRHAASTPPRPPRSLGWRLLALPVMLAGVLLLGGPGLAWPIYGVLRWRGAWRLLSGAALAYVGFIGLRIVAGTFVDPTSHNLWPFELVFADIVAAGFMLLVFVAKRCWSWLHADARG